MAGNTEAFQHIKDYFHAFREGIERCQSAAQPTSADLQDVYGRLGRLRDRYNFEKSGLSEPEKRALSKVFERDVFTEGMMKIRQVGEHVVTNDFVIRTPNNRPVSLDQGSSAMAIFLSPIVHLDTVDGEIFILDHLIFLKEMKRRIDAAMTRAEFA